VLFYFAANVVHVVRVDFLDGMVVCAAPGIGVLRFNSLLGIIPDRPGARHTS